ncbi:MAG TPA: Clp protease N-terminal domain-containing protein [Pirellulales bacterium]|jgi:ATP-dependent Clp protease ATP-binding subunit ClpC|nr:Clp protease N-terminal domain-containing protein [Pirellulales bacterium]
MYERFTDRARKVMALAHQDALRRHAPAVDAAHILLGLLEEGSGVAAHVLRGLGVDWETCSAAFTARNKPHPSPAASTASQPPAAPPRSFWRATGDALRRFLAAQRGPRLPQTSASRRLIERAMEESRALGHKYIGTEHLLLGLVRQSDCTAAELLTEQGVQLEGVRRGVLELLGHA